MGVRSGSRRICSKYPASARRRSSPIARDVYFRRGCLPVLGDNRWRSANRLVFAGEEGEYVRDDPVQADGPSMSQSAPARDSSSRLRREPVLRLPRIVVIGVRSSRETEEFVLCGVQPAQMLAL